MGTLKHKDDNDCVKQIIEQWLLQQPLIRFAILFGSFAKKTNTPGSDIDIGIKLDKPLSTETKLTLLQSFSELTDRRIDLVDLSTTGEPLLNEIIQHGKVIKGTDNDLALLSIKNVNMMQDFTPYLIRTLKERLIRLLH
jgi:predicted nucleotidyltransferase